MSKKKLIENPIRKTECMVEFKSTFRGDKRYDLIFSFKSGSQKTIPFVVDKNDEIIWTGEMR